MALTYAEELARLQLALEEEMKSKTQGILYVEAERGSEFASACDRDRMAQWLSMLTRELQYKQEVYYRATSLLDAFLSSRKVRRRFVNCVSATCFYIAAKLEESTDAVISLLDILLERYRCDWSRRDIQRMELVVMQQLEFHLSRPTVLDFITSFHSLALSSGLIRLPPGLTVESHLKHMAICTQPVVYSSRLMKHRLSMLALAVLGCDLKLLDCDWLSTILSLQTLTQVRGGELSVCYEAVAAIYPAVASQHPLQLQEVVPTTCTTTTAAVSNGKQTAWKNVSVSLTSDEPDGKLADKKGEEHKKKLKKRIVPKPPLRRTVNVAVV